ncbi:MAG: preprotein translocase subunit SecE [Gammaproteobacteria bacterium]|nr:preprotein translocase subunit SecE [Gammaproteobacteria bacterium]
MNDVAKTESTGAVDKAKLWIAVALVAGGIVAFYWMRGAQAAWLRWTTFAAGLLLGGVVFALSRYGREFWQFVGEARVELYKVFWPTRDETIKTTIVVFVFVTLLALFFWGLDTLLALATRALSLRAS